MPDEMVFAVQDMETKLDILFQKQLFPLVSACSGFLGLGVYSLYHTIEQQPWRHRNRVV